MLLRIRSGRHDFPKRHWTRKIANKTSSDECICGMKKNAKKFMSVTIHISKAKMKKITALGERQALHNEIENQETKTSDENVIWCAVMSFRMRTQTTCEKGMAAIVTIENLIGLINDLISCVKTDLIIIDLIIITAN